MESNPRCFQMYVNRFQTIFEVVKEGRILHDIKVGGNLDKTDHQTTCYRFWLTTLYYYQSIK